MPNIKIVFRVLGLLCIILFFMNAKDFSLAVGYNGKKLEIKYGSAIEPQVQSGKDIKSIEVPRVQNKRENLKASVSVPSITALKKAKVPETKTEPREDNNIVAETTIPIKAEPSKDIETAALDKAVVIEQPKIVLPEVRDEAKPAEIIQPPATLFAELMGKAAPGALVLLYHDNKKIEETRAGNDGAYIFKVDPKIKDAVEVYIDGL